MRDILTLKLPIAITTKFLYDKNKRAFLKGFVIDLNIVKSCFGLNETLFLSMTGKVAVNCLIRAKEPESHRMLISFCRLS